MNYYRASHTICWDEPWIGLKPPRITWIVIFISVAWQPCLQEFELLMQKRVVVVLAMFAVIFSF